MATNKTSQTLKALAEKCEQFKFGSWKIEVLFHEGEITGFNQIQPPEIKFRAKEPSENDKIEEAV